MSRHRRRHQRTSRHLGVALATVLTALLVASPSAATMSARSSSARAADAKAWCALVIKINTKYGTMRNKRYLPNAPLSAWKGAIDAALAGRSHILAVTPKSIKKAMTHELTYFAHVKANHYNLKTPLAPYTIADVKQLANFQRTKCGITGI
jgi:hypothetical protein